MSKKRKYHFWTILLIAGVFAGFLRPDSLIAETTSRSILLTSSKELPLFDLFERARVHPTGSASRQLLQLDVGELKSSGQIVHYSFALVAQIASQNRSEALRRLESLIMGQSFRSLEALSPQAAQDIACFALASQGSKREQKFLLNLALGSSPTQSECALHAFQAAGYRLDTQQLIGASAKPISLSPNAAEDLALRLSLKNKGSSITWNEILQALVVHESKAAALGFFRDLAASQKQIVPPLSHEKWLGVFQQRKDIEELFLLLSVGREAWLEARLKSRHGKYQLLNTPTQVFLSAYFSHSSKALPKQSHTLNINQAFPKRYPLRPMTKTPLQVWNLMSKYQKPRPQRSREYTFPSTTDIERWLADPHARIGLAAAFGLINSGSPDVSQLLLHQYLTTTNASQRCSLLSAWRKNPALAPSQLQAFLKADPAWLQFQKSSAKEKNVAWFQIVQDDDLQESLLFRNCSPPRKGTQMLNGIHVALPLPPE